MFGQDVVLASGPAPAFVPACAGAPSFLWGARNLGIYTYA